MNDKVILIDDHKMLVDSISMFLNRHDVEVSGYACQYERAVKLIEESDAKFAIIDVNLAGVDGAGLIEVAKESDMHVIMLSAYTDIRIVKNVMRCGAEAYISKESELHQILQAMDSIKKGKVYYDPYVQERLNSFQTLNAPKDFYESERKLSTHLTRRELEILKLIAMEKTSDEIAEELNISKHTVNTHRKSLLIKLKVKNSVGLALWASENGLVNL